MHRLGVWLSVGLTVALIAIVEIGDGSARADSLTAGGFTTSAVAPTSVIGGGTVSLAVSVTSATAAVVLVDVEVFAPGGAKVTQSVAEDQGFQAGQRREYVMAWTAPVGSADGAYTVRVGVFSPNWQALLHWNDAAASTVVLAAASTAGSVRIMPLGDSLTEGGPLTGGYRPDLTRLLVADGLAVDFVGSVASGPPSLPDPDHEGHAGARIDALTAAVDGWLAAARPQIVLLLAGTTDIADGYEPATAPARLGGLLDRIGAARPEAWLIVGSLPPQGSDEAARAVRTYNAAIPSLVSARAATGRRVLFADTAAGVGPDDLASDGVQLRDDGNRKVAAAWYPAIRVALGLAPAPAAIPLTPVTPRPAPVAISPSPTPTPSPRVPAMPTSPRPTPTPPPFSTSVVLSRSIITRGSALTLTAWVTSARSATVLVDLEVYDSLGYRVFQQSWDAQALDAGEPATFTTSWRTSPRTAIGPYTVRVGVFTAGWRTLLAWNEAAASFTVTR